MCDINFAAVAATSAAGPPESARDAVDAVDDAILGVRERRGRDLS
jgi:hypothetical protein